MLIGVEYTRNYIQQRCRVIGIRAFLRSLAFNCFNCRRVRAQGLQPPMADLPDIRFQETQSPIIFTNVGVDYLGSFAVVHRDAELKTYICLFNCLVKTAIQLEAAEDLSTDKCWTAIPLFIARRGQPRLFLSDNRSNFLGARKQITRRQVMLDHEYIKDQLLKQSVKWMNQLFSGTSVPQNSPQMAFFVTIVSEAEYVVNSRPLTHVRSNHDTTTHLHQITSCLEGPSAMFLEPFSTRHLP
ncbi:uncharacterized protein LOC142351714 [Convolutriloba macropyga]|uniref:uncharacterized protein LOC142351714 n=1 Tax=Convolutriloba macropyga TaxID=536237 RepID=UPI003F525180